MATQEQDIQKTGPQTNKELQAKNNSPFRPYQFNGQGPTLTQEQYIGMEEYRRDLAPHYIPPKAQIDNYGPISTIAARIKWWEEEGKLEYGDSVSDYTVSKIKTCLLPDGEV